MSIIGVLLRRRWTFACRCFGSGSSAVCARSLGVHLLVSWKVPGIKKRTNVTHKDHRTAVTVTCISDGTLPIETDLASLRSRIERVHFELALARSNRSMQEYNFPM